MSSEVMIEGRNLSKAYMLYENPADRLKQMLLPRAAPLRRLLRLPAPESLHREFWALHDISLEVRRGETLGIIGENGSGKSTLLQVICGTLNPTSGMRMMKGRVAALLELGSGFNPEFTGRENIYLNASLYGLSKKEIDARLARIIEFAEIGIHIDQPVRTYSSGMFVRLAFSVVANIDADVLIIDEALAVGDARFQQKCMRFLKTFQERGAILFVSHDTGAMMSFCSRVIWLSKGKLEAEGDPKDVCEAYLGYLYQKSSPSEHPEDQGNGESLGTLTPDLVDGADEDATRNAAETKKNERREEPEDTQTDDSLFNQDSKSFGDGRAQIIGADIRKVGGLSTNAFSGNEEVALSIRVRTKTALSSLIVGFIVKDRFGQYIFGDNTFAASEHRLDSQSNQIVNAVFEFEMPSLMSGTYAVAVAVASGTLKSHVQHHWVHEALVFTIQNQRETGVLLGVPMKHIELNALP